MQASFNTGRSTSSLNSSQNQEGSGDQDSQVTHKPLPRSPSLELFSSAITPSPSTPTSNSPVLMGFKRSNPTDRSANSKPSSSPQQSLAVSPRAVSSTVHVEDSKAKGIGRIGGLFKRASKSDSTDHKTPPLDVADSIVPAKSAEIPKHRKSTGNPFDSDEFPQETTITPQGILDLYGRSDTSDQQVTFADALKYFHSMGQELVEVWKHPARGMNLFEERINRFVTTILPELEMVQLLRRTKTPSDINSQDALPEDVLALRSKYSVKPINLNDQTDALDRILFYNFEVCRALVEAWNNPYKELDLKVKIDNLKLQAQPRFTSVNKQEQRNIEIQSINFTSVMEETFLKEVENLLQGILLDLKQPINSQDNRSRILKLLPNDDEIKRKLEELDNLSNSGAMVRSITTVISKITSSRGDRDESKKTTDEEYTLDRYYVILCCAYQLCEMLTIKYSVALKGICQELQKPAICQGEPSSIGFVKDVMELVNAHIRSPWATMNRHPANVTGELLGLVRSKIEFLELPVIMKGMKDLYRATLVQNMTFRQCQIRPFNYLLKSLVDKLYFQSMKTPQDVPRVFTLQGHVCCKVNGKEVQAESNTPEGRFKAFLQTISEPFGQPDMFLNLANLRGFPIVPNSRRTMESIYLDAYKKLMTLNERDRAALKEQFEEIYGLNTFEKAFKYFKVFQNILEQGILYHFAGALMKARMEKFNLAGIGFVKPLEKMGFKKNEFAIEVNGSRCKFRIIRFDGLLHPEVLLRQEYSIVFDVDKDEIVIPTKDQVFLSIDCPSSLAEEKAEIRTLLFDLPLIIESLDFPPLKINYTTEKGPSQSMEIE
jgi:hypothetical protein